MASIQELHDGTIEKDLINWMHSFSDPIDIMNNIEVLFSKLKVSNIEGEVHSSVAINGPVHIGKGSIIHANVTLDGPVIIGENVSIRSHAQIRNHTYLGSNCVVGHGADIKRSLCLNGAKIQDGTFVGDSLLGMKARIGSGSILSNRKFDQTEIKYKNDAGAVVPSGRHFFGSVLGQQVRIGANTVLSPGTLIGEYTWIASNIVIHGRYGSDIFIRPPKQELIITEKSRKELVSGDGDYEHI